MFGYKARLTEDSVVMVETPSKLVADRAKTCGSDPAQMQRALSSSQNGWTAGLRKDALPLTHSVWRAGRRMIWPSHSTEPSWSVNRDES